MWRLTDGNARAWAWDVAGIYFFNDKTFWGIDCYVLRDCRFLMARVLWKWYVTEFFFFLCFTSGGFMWGWVIPWPIPITLSRVDPPRTWVSNSFLMCHQPDTTIYSVFEGALCPRAVENVASVGDVEPQALKPAIQNSPVSWPVSFKKLSLPMDQRQVVGFDFWLL